MRKERLKKATFLCVAILTVSIFATIPVVESSYPFYPHRPYYRHLYSYHPYYQHYRYPIPIQIYGYHRPHMFSQCTLIVEVSPPAETTAGLVSGGGPVDCGTVARASVQRIEEDQPGVRKKFKGWSGDSTSSTTDVKVFMDRRQKKVVAEFDVMYELKVFSNKNFRTVGSGFWKAGTLATLSAPPEDWDWVGYYYKFKGWSGDVDATTNSVTVTMNRPKTVYATWEYQLFSLPTWISAPIIILILALLALLLSRKVKISFAQQKPSQPT